MIVTKVGRRGQITLPKAIRQELQLSEGDRIGFVRKSGELVLQPMRSTLKDHRGTVIINNPQDFESIRKQVRQARATHRGSNDDK